MLCSVFFTFHESRHVVATVFRSRLDHPLHRQRVGSNRQKRHGCALRFALASRLVASPCFPLVVDLVRYNDNSTLVAEQRGDLGSLPCALRDDFPNARKKTYVKDGPRSSFRLSSSLLGPCHLLPQHPSIQAGPRRALWNHGPTEEDNDAGIRIGKCLRYKLPGSPGLLCARVQRSAK